MSDEMMDHGHHGHETEYEREDLGTHAIFVFMAGLAVTGLVIYFIINGMYDFLDRYERAQMATASPLSTSKAAMSRVVTQEDMDKTFQDNGAPMLETDERTELRKFLMDQEDQLNSYGWVDQKAGVAHIPIERAMDLIVERGLPVRPQDIDSNATAAGANTAGANTNKETAKKSAAVKKH